ncbi:hypothetical protein [Domibacillus aminovorans]|uniref:Uncharacterized protein n=1 Tax=Domibacillus aminovorans TaxID=29332 RepID=A0A177L4J0_9BACI|nr:hypothetical protein [Domibacillus aminovorans]OAH60473.1 hypothetical protein AWH49_16565 [Domibacillus aminovorans]
MEEGPPGSEIRTKERKPPEKKQEKLSERELKELKGNESSKVRKSKRRGIQPFKRVGAVMIVGNYIAIKPVSKKAPFTDLPERAISCCIYEKVKIKTDRFKLNVKRLYK